MEHTPGEAAGMGEGDIGEGSGAAGMLFLEM